MNKKVMLVGMGMQGKAALHDLVNSGEVSHITVVDNQPDLLTYLSRYPTAKVSGRILDASDEASLSLLMRNADVVIEALPGDFALRIGRLAADCGVSLVSSMYYLNPGEQDPARIQSIQNEILQIDQKAKEKEITILTEFGLDPGLDLVLGATAIREMDEVLEFHTYGAGLPAADARLNPLKYKFSWSAIGVMKAYKRQAKIISKGKALKIEAEKVFEKGNYHLIDVKELGVKLECFPNGDAVHYAELFGIRDSVQEMGRYTCRYPGHCAFWDIMTKIGFLDEQAIRVGDASVSPIEFTAALLASQGQFNYADNEQDLAFIRIDVRGRRKGKRTRLIYQLIDRRDMETGFTSMQRTVGFTMSLAARLILERKLRPGLLTPLDVPYDSVFPALEKHNICVVRREMPWS